MKQPLVITKPIRLKDFSPEYHAGLDKETAHAKTEKLCRRIGELQELLRANGRQAIVILLQGMDTSGKDGTGKSVLEFVNPLGVETANFKAPVGEELRHDYLWRVHQAVPSYGHIGIFNRSHYEEVLVVRVMNLQPKKVWQERFEQINAFEKHLAANNVILLKFFLHISREEQAERLQERLDNPRKHWKFEQADLAMRAKWPQFMQAYEDVINKCSTPQAPWHIVPANRKWYRNYFVAHAVVGAMEKLKLKWPKAREDLSGIKVK